MVLALSCHADGVTGTGPLEANVMAIGIAPGRDEWKRTKRPFTGSAGRMLDATLSAVGYSRSRIYTTNLICWWNDSPSPSEIEACWPRLLAEIAAVKPRLIVLCGAIVTGVFLSEYRKTFGQLRGGVYWSQRFNCWLMPTYHPAAFLYGDGESGPDVADFARDLLKIEPVERWPLDEHWGDVSYTVAETVKEAEDWLRRLQGPVALDVETTYEGKSAVYEEDVPDGQQLPHVGDSKLLCLSVSNDAGTLVIPGWLARPLAQGAYAGEQIEWVMHNGMFDIAQVRKLLGVQLKLSEDTMLMSYSLDERGGASEENERAVGIHGLKGLAREYCAAGFYDRPVLKVHADELHEYNAKDAAYTYRLFRLFKERQIADNVRDSFYRTLLIPGSNALSEIQERGVNIDTNVMREYAMSWIPIWLTMHDELVSEATELGWPTPPIKLTSTPQLIRFVYDVLKAPIGPLGRTTRKDVMELLAEKYEIPWCKKLRQWRNLDHMINSYVIGIEDDIKADGRLHPEPLLHGSRSGRLSYHKPPIQTIPNKGVDPEMAQLRRMYSATDERYVICEADLKQAEFWATYLYSGDPVLLAMLETGDIHTETAKENFGVDEAYPLFGFLRFLSKRINFGILYNRQAQAFVDNPWGNEPPAGLDSVVVWNLQTAKAYIARFAERFARMWAWRQEAVREAQRAGEQQTPTGRKRRYWLTNWKSVNQSINFGPQALAHDVLFDSLIKLHDLLKPYDSHVLFEVHDAIVFELNRSHLGATLPLIKSVMTEPKFGYDRGIPVEIAIGPN